MMDILSCQLINRFEAMKSGETSYQVLKPSFQSNACQVDLEVEARKFSNKFSDNVSLLFPSQMLWIKTSFGESIAHLTLLLPRSSIDDLVFSVFTSNFVKLSYKISLLKYRFVTLFFIRFSYNFQKITLISSRIGRCIICALILGFLYPKTVKNTNNPVADDKIGQILSTCQLH